MDNDRPNGDAATIDSANESSNRLIARFASGALASGAVVLLIIEYLVLGDRSLLPAARALALLALSGSLLILHRSRLRPRIVTYALQGFFIVAIPVIALLLDSLHNAVIWSVPFVFLIASLIYVRPTFIIITVVTVAATQSARAVWEIPRLDAEGLIVLIIKFLLLAIAATVALVVNKKYARQLNLNSEANSLIKSELVQSGERMRILELYTRKSLVAIVESGGDPAAIAAVSREMAVMFCDLRDFARLSQRMEPGTLIASLNDFFEAMGAVIRERGGEIDKLMGDCILATFPDADSALSAAIEMKEALFGLNERNREAGRPHLRTGIGIHFGKVVVGNIGSREKMDLTIIGDTVNVASRLEALTKYYITDIIVSEDFKDSLSIDMKMRFIDNVRVKGRDEPLRLYEVYHHHRADTVTAKELEGARIASAYGLYTEGHFSDAISVLLQAGEKTGDHETLIGFYKDPFINVLLDRCIVLFQRQKTGDLPSWDGIFRFKEK